MSEFKSIPRVMTLRRATPGEVPYLRRLPTSSASPTRSSHGGTRGADPASEQHPPGSPLPVPGVGLIDMVVADLPVGFLFTLAISSLGVYGVTLAGWSSNNKYALLGGLRASAQMISYEIAMGMSTVCVLLLAGNVNLNAIVGQQASQGWNVILLTLAFFIFAVAGLAETNRVPFDLPEAESELVGGYHTEYAGMRFALLFLSVGFIFRKKAAPPQAAERFKFLRKVGENSKKRKEENKLTKDRHDVPSGWLENDAKKFEHPTENESPVIYAENDTPDKLFEKLDGTQL